MMTAALFTSASLRLNPANLYEFQDAASGVGQARLVEVARVRSPRGSFLNSDPVQTPRLTFAVMAPDGTTLMYADRAEHLKFNPVAPQMVFVGTDGTVLGRVEYDSHSTFQGGGRVIGTTEQGWNLTPGGRLLDANSRPLGDLVYEQPPNMDRPTLPDGRDPRTIRWIASDGTQLAERRDGVLYLDNRVTGAWRALIIASYMAVAFEFHLPISDGQASEAVPDVYPGYAGLHAAYDEYQRRFVEEYKTPVRTRFSQGVVRSDVQLDRLTHSWKLVFPVMIAVAVIALIIRFIT